MALFRRRYGSSPLHLLASLAALVGIVYFLRLTWQANPTHHVNLIGWLLVLALAHDLLLVPVYSLLDLIARVGTGDNVMQRVRVVNHIRFPVIVSAGLFLVYFPLITGNGRENYVRALGEEPGDYLGRWLAITAGLFVLSALVYAVRLRSAAAAGRRSANQRP